MVPWLAFVLGAALGAVALAWFVLELAYRRLFGFSFTR